MINFLDLLLPASTISDERTKSPDVTDFVSTVLLSMGISHGDDDCGEEN